MSLDIHSLLRILTDSLSIPFADEIVNMIIGDLVIVYPVITLPTSHAYKIYKTRMELNQKLNDNSVIGYNSLIYRLGELDDEEINSVKLITKYSGYIIFFNPDRIVFSIIKLNNQNAERAEKLRENNLSRGIESSGVIYYKTLPN